MHAFVEIELCFLKTTHQRLLIPELPSNRKRKPSPKADTSGPSGAAAATR